MDAQNLKRINQLAALAKERPLTPEEEQERAQRRAQYLETFRANTRSVLESTVFERPDGTTFQLKSNDRNRDSGK